MTFQRYIKSDSDIAAMREAGRRTAEVLAFIRPHVVPGITTEKLDKLCHEYIVDTLGDIPAPLNYRGFPKSICTSVNDVICHGIPKPSEKLKNGDIVNIDVSVIHNEFHGDSSQMFFVGEPSPEAVKIVRVSYECLLAGIAVVRDGARIGDIGAAIQQHARHHQCSIVREYCGHGIGRVFHEAPQILHFGTAGTGGVLRSGMTFTIEPMVNLGSAGTKVRKDGWTVVTTDKSLSAQWEHTLLVTDTGADILTAWDHDPLITYGWQ